MPNKDESLLIMMPLQIRTSVMVRQMRITDDRIDVKANEDEFSLGHVMTKHNESTLLMIMVLLLIVPICHQGQCRKCE